MNSITITGRLTQDPEQRTLPSGSTVCRLRLAVDGMGRGGRDEVGYVNVSAFGNPGEAAARVLTKGWLVAVDGRLQYGEWETDEGTRRHDYEIVGNVEFLAAPRGENDNQTVATGAGEQVAVQPSGTRGPRPGRGAGPTPASQHGHAQPDIASHISRAGRAVNRGACRAAAGADRKGWRVLDGW